MKLLSMFVMEFSSLSQFKILIFYSETLKLLFSRRQSEEAMNYNSP